MKKQYLVPTMEQSVFEPQGNLLQAVSTGQKIPETPGDHGGLGW